MAVARHLQSTEDIGRGVPAEAGLESPDGVGVDGRIPVIRARVNLLDTWIDKVDMAETVNRIDDFIRFGRPQQIVTVNLDFLRLTAQDHAFRALINAASLVVPDGMPLIWATRVLGDPLPERVAGVDLVLECSRLAAEKGRGVFLLGAAPGVADQAASVLRERFPGLRVVGTHAPSSTSPEDDRVTLGLIRAVQPDILFVAFGAPRQDQWIQKYLDELDVPVCIGVGGAFDMLSGRIRRAPMWMQRAGLEWFFRFLNEPQRLFKRYFVHDLPIFLRLMIHSRLSGRASPGSGLSSGVEGADGEVPEATIARCQVFQREAAAEALPQQMVHVDVPR